MVRRYPHQGSITPQDLDFHEGLFGLGPMKMVAQRHNTLSRRMASYKAQPVAPIGLEYVATTLH